MNADLQQLIAALPYDDSADDDAAALALVSQRAIPTGRLARLWTLGTIQAQIAAAYAALWVRSLFDRSDRHAERLVETHMAAAMRILGGMVYLRGAVMKVGQALATYPNLVPDEIAATLARLHFDAPPMHFALVREQLCNELDRELGEVFEEFDQRAFAAASLGQVHRARLRSGERVAVKIQYPGIAQTIRSDLQNLIAVLAPLRFTREWENVSAQLDEIRDVLGAEVDYQAEAASLEHARSLFTDDDGIVIPHVYRDLSTSRVLTMEHIEGRHLDAWLATNPSQAQRDAFGTKMYVIALRMYYSGRCAYADPHPGNYLFLDDGRLALLDFGCVPRYDEAEWELLSEMDAAFYRDHDALRAALTRFCDLSADELNDESRMSVLEESFRWMIEPLLHRPFDFGDPAHLRAEVDIVARAVAGRYTRSHPMQFYISRTVLGLRALLHRMKARVDVRGVHARELPAAGWSWVDQLLREGAEL
jgi:predicted unusual protein kinase regulating ubiquinone biosynthesis (AarF/ABC1/UbiB family)